MFTLWFHSFLNPSDWDKFDEGFHNFQSAKVAAKRALDGGLDEVQIRDENSSNTFTYKVGDTRL